MTRSWRTIRVFISSTFRDMHAERDWLVGIVFPALRERLLPYRIHYLQYRGPLLDFFHRNFQRAVVSRYFADDARRAAAHAHLAEYFAAQDYFLESVEEQRARARRLMDEVRSDAAARACGAARTSLDLVKSKLESVVTVSPGGEPVAWFPAALSAVAALPMGGAWSGAVSQHLYIIALEGRIVLEGGGQGAANARINGPGAT